MIYNKTIENVKRAILDALSHSTQKRNSAERLEKGKQRIAIAQARYSGEMHAYQDALAQIHSFEQNQLPAERQTEEFADLFGEGSEAVTVVRISVGSVSFDYALIHTSAKREYDAFGTIEVSDGGNTRIVAIKSEHVRYHVARYGSGMAWSKPCTIYGMAGHFVEKMFQRMINGKEKK